MHSNGHSYQRAEARARAGLSKAAAADLIHAHEGSWVKWERGERPMHPAFWELFLLKARLIPLTDPEPEPVRRIELPKLLSRSRRSH